MENLYNSQIDLTNCDKEPIHLIGKIQPHGFLLIFDKKSLELEQLSENASDYLMAGTEDILGKSLQSLIPEEFASLEEVLPELESSYYQLLTVKGRQYYAFIHEASGKIILECEPYQAVPEKEVVESAFFLSSLLAQLNTLDSLESISALVADAVQALLDIDRVLIFRFDQDWHAEAIAEKIKPGIRSYLGHHFPASDIPAPARALLEVKHIRHIPDITVQAVSIIPYLNPSTESPTDILKSELRYPSELHLEYLKNMDVYGSISFSIMVKGKLWGLVSCSNEKPTFIDFQKRQLCDQIVKAYSNTLVSSKEKRDYQQFQQYKQIEKALLEQLVKEQSILDSLQANDLNLLSITEASGAAILQNNELATLGLCPEEGHIFEIADWLSKNSTEPVFQTIELSEHVERAFHYRDKACGLLSLEISRFNKEYIFFFKPEVKGKRIWAGNPEKQLAGEDFRIHPRKSFEQWEEIIKGKSAPWSINEVEIAQILLKDLTAVRLMNQNKKLDHLNKAYQKTANSLETKNQQLQDFTRIITHNFRSPLANIQGLYDIYKNNPDLLGADTFIDKVYLASDNMLATIDDLNAILRTEAGQQLDRQTVKLSGLIDKELQNLNAIITNTGAEISMELLAPELTIQKVYLESIIHNLLSNALKYSSPERTPQITIKSWLEKEKFYLSVADNGVGINMDKYGHKLFGIYQTFHQNTDSRGVGLYLTKMQVESLGGNIQAQSEPGKGTTFTVNFDLSLSDETTD